MEPRPFRDRTEAGRLLAEKLAAYANCPDAIVLGLPCGCPWESGSLADADPGKRMEQSKNIQDPQNYSNDHDAVQH